MENVFVGVGLTIIAGFLLIVSYALGSSTMIDDCDKYGGVQWQGVVYECSKVVSD